MLEAWDTYGRTIKIPREEWRLHVLPLNFQKCWNDPDSLAGLLNNALNDGFYADCLEPARRLVRIDREPKHALNQLAFVLLKLNRLDEGERLLADAIKQYGPDALFLNNLAKFHSARGRHSDVERTLREALALDPNVENTFGWYVALHRERGGEAAASACHRELAGLPGSWRAQLWLAREALQARQLAPALEFYHEALHHAGRPVPLDLLKQMSADLGNAAHLPELLQLTAPHFEVSVHGLPVGNNLIKAYTDLGQLDQARKVLDQLYALNRTDWKPNLHFWDSELAKARVSLVGERKEPPQIAMLTIAGPVWLKPESPAAELFPGKLAGAPTVALLGGTAQLATNSQRVRQQMADDPGRMSRALPLFLAEQVAFRTEAHVVTLVPWVTGEDPAFMVGGVAWEDATAAHCARQGTPAADYAVTIHLLAHTEPWSVELRLLRTIDALCLATLAGSFPSAKPEAGLLVLTDELMARLREHAELPTLPAPGGYEPPAPSHVADYLLRLEQLLAVRCAGMEGVSKGALSGEREIVDGHLQLCLDFPQDVRMRILLAQTLLALKRARPAVPAEYREKVALLQAEKPLPEPAHSVVQRMLNEAMA